jgi:hypothetical protein
MTVLSVGLGVGRTIVVSGSHTHPSYSCDGWVCDLGVVGDLSFRRAPFSSQLESMVDGTLEGFVFVCRLGCRWDYHRVWIVSSFSCRPTQCMRVM